MIKLAFPVLAVLAMIPSISYAFSLNMMSDSAGTARPPKKWYGGAGVGRLVLDDKAAKETAVQCKNDMVLVERIQGSAKKESGLFVPDEDLPRLHICRG